MKKDDPILYHKYSLRLLEKVRTCNLEHVPRGANKMVGMLANPAATLAVRAEESITVLVISQCVITSLEDGNE